MATSGNFTTSGGYASRNLKFQWTQASQSIANNTTTINWSVVGVGGNSYYYEAGNFKVIIDGSIVYSSANRIKLYSGTTVASGSYTFTHGNDGTRSFSAYVEAGIYYYAVNSTGTGSFTLNAIPRATTPTLASSSANLNSIIAITTSRASSSFTHTLKYKFGNATGTIATNVATWCQWSIPFSLANQIPNSTSGTCTITCETYNGSTLIGTKSVTLTLNVPDSVKPSCDFNYSDATSCYSTYGKFVQNKSALLISVSTTTAYGSPIKSYSIQVDGKTYTSATVTTSILTGSGTKNITVSVTDNRNRTSTSVVKSINILPYSPPIIGLTAQRCTSSGTADNEGSYMKISIDGTISSLDDQNSGSYRIRYKRSNSSTWITLSGSGTTYTSSPIALDISLTCAVEVTITDDLSSTEKVTNIPIAFVLMDFYSTGKGIAFGKVAEQDGFDCDMISFFKKNSYFTGDVTFLGDVDFSGLIDDYVVAQGTSGSWSYRKWNSGKMEQWAIVTPTFTSWSTWQNNYWYQSNRIDITFGASFLANSTPVVTATNFQTNWAIPMVDYVSNTKFKISGVRPNAGVTTANSYYYSVYAVGTWK